MGTERIGRAADREASATPAFIGGLGRNPLHGGGGSP